MKIGITINMSHAIWANGMQQNIVFLYEILKECGHDCFYITPEPPKFGVGKDHIAMDIKDLIKDKSENIDLLIIAGFDVPQEIFDILKSRNKNIKCILIHYGNKLLNDIHHGICGRHTESSPLFRHKYIDEVWTSPHYDFAIPYLRTYYKTDAVKICPYIWDPHFIKIKTRELKDKKLNPHFSEDLIRNISIFEPNKNFTKTCLIPLSIIECFQHKFGNEINSANVFCCEKIRDRKYLTEYVNMLDISKRKDFLFFNNRWAKMEACAKFGKTILSHQIYNELNYSHLEALYLGLPLIHNSKRLMEFGYYYPDFDIEMAANQIKSAFINHSQTINQYKEDCSVLFHKFSPYNKENVEKYKILLND